MTKVPLVKLTTTSIFKIKGESDLKEQGLTLDDLKTEKGWGLMSKALYDEPGYADKLKNLNPACKDRSPADCYQAPRLFDVIPFPFSFLRGSIELTILDTNPPSILDHEKTDAAPRPSTDKAGSGQTETGKPVEIACPVPDAVTGVQGKPAVPSTTKSGGKTGKPGTPGVSTIRKTKPKIPPKPKSEDELWNRMRQSLEGATQ